ncbi:MAG TPA: Na-translocating system protein MpsC family protein [Anaerolineae bacterium]|nr:Na-translocating system protein MpsC family protein [Anaerolineae bacterium]HMR63815.1 Na-translocating system protein MpsC family protein [Anaerolineae bacterium]
MSKTVDVLKKNGLSVIEEYTAALGYPTEHLAQTFLRAWQEAHGTPSGSASVLTGADTLAVFIEETLTKAEFALAEQTDGQLILQRYIESVFDQLAPELIDAVEATAGRRVSQKCVSVSLKCGWILCLFKLADKFNTGDTDGAKRFTKIYSHSSAARRDRLAGD